MTSTSVQNALYTENAPVPFLFMGDQREAKGHLFGETAFFETERDSLLFDRAADTVFGSGENERKKEVHVHNEIPSIRIEFSGNIDGSVDVDTLMREMQKRIKEEMEASTDFYYRG